MRSSARRLRTRASARRGACRRVAARELEGEPVERLGVHDLEPGGGDRTGVAARALEEELLPLVEGQAGDEVERLGEAGLEHEHVARGPGDACGLDEERVGVVDVVEQVLGDDDVGARLGEARRHLHGIAGEKGARHGLGEQLEADPAQVAPRVLELDAPPVGDASQRRGHETLAAPGLEHAHRTTERGCARDREDALGEGVVERTQQRLDALLADRGRLLLVVVVVVVRLVRDLRLGLRHRAQRPSAAAAVVQMWYTASFGTRSVAHSSNALTRAITRGSSVENRRRNRSKRM